MKYPGYNVYLFGCSHTAIMQSVTYPFFEGIEAKCVGGNTNDTILREVKEEIIKITENFTKNVDNVYFQIQFTYLNRTEFWSYLHRQYTRFHSPSVTNQPWFPTADKSFIDISNDFYTNWLTYFFEEEERLKSLIRECKILKTLMDTFGIKYNWHLWAGLHYSELEGSKREFEQLNLVFEADFINLGFQKFEDFWYFEDYAIKHKMRIIDDTPNVLDEHLTEKSCWIYAKMIDKQFNKKMNKTVI